MDAARASRRSLPRRTSWCSRIRSSASRIVEACVATHCRRAHPTYYIEAQGEGDVAYVHDGRFWSVEVKWANQLRPKTGQADRALPERRDLEQEPPARHDCGRRRLAALDDKTRSSIDLQSSDRMLRFQKDLHRDRCAIEVSNLKRTELRPTCLKRLRDPSPMGLGNSNTIQRSGEKTNGT